MYGLHQTVKAVKEGNGRKGRKVKMFIMSDMGIPGCVIGRKKVERATGKETS
jgi:hypothetical protein